MNTPIPRIPRKSLPLAALAGLLAMSGAAEASCLHQGGQVGCPTNIPDGTSSSFFNSDGGITWANGGISGPGACCTPFTSSTPAATSTFFTPSPPAVTSTFSTVSVSPTPTAAPSTAPSVAGNTMHAPANAEEQIGLTQPTDSLKDDIARDDVRKYIDEDIEKEWEASLMKKIDTGVPAQPGIIKYSLDELLITSSPPEPAEPPTVVKITVEGNDIIKEYSDGSVVINNSRAAVGDPGYFEPPQPAEPTAVTDDYPGNQVPAEPTAVRVTVVSGNQTNTEYSDGSKKSITKETYGGVTSINITGQRADGTVYNQTEQDGKIVGGDVKFPDGTIITSGSGGMDGLVVGDSSDSKPKPVAQPETPGIDAPASEEPFISLQQPPPEYSAPTPVTGADAQQAAPLVVIPFVLM